MDKQAIVERVYIQTALKTGAVDNMGLHVTTGYIIPMLGLVGALQALADLDERS